MESAKALKDCTSPASQWCGDERKVRVLHRVRSTLFRSVNTYLSYIHIGKRIYTLTPFLWRRVDTYLYSYRQTNLHTNTVPVVKSGYLRVIYIGKRIDILFLWCGDLFFYRQTNLRHSWDPCISLKQ